MKSIEDVKPGDTLGRYELLAPVAQGGMAAVWAARLKGSRGFQRVVAIKTILPDLVDNPAFEQMFLDEAELASRVRHPNVAQILDLGEEGDVLYLVMEWVDGESLSVLAKAVHRKTGRPLPLAIASRIVMQAAAGLHAAHELRDEDGELLLLVHRDVSPQNILLTYDGAVKVVDFGVAKARTSNENTGQIKGKVPYMSPEQARGDAIDRRTDVFALGTIFYLLSLGTHPFRGENDKQTLDNIISRPVRRPRDVDPSFPKEIEEVLLKALAKDPDERYPTMAAFEEALAEAVAKLGILTSDAQIAELAWEMLEERAKKRRDGLKEAMKAADEQGAAFRESTLTLASGISHSGLTLAPRPLPPKVRTEITRATHPVASRMDGGPIFTLRRAAFASAALVVLASLSWLLLTMARSRAEQREALLPTEKAAEPQVVEVVTKEVAENPVEEPLEGAAPALMDDPELELVVEEAPLPRRGKADKADGRREASPEQVENKPAPPRKRTKLPEVRDPGF